MDIKTLIAVATGEIPHNYRNGLCPDELQPDSRDPDCPACKILIEAATEHDAVMLRLREAEARVAELEAERAELERQEAAGYISDDALRDLQAREPGAPPVFPMSSDRNHIPLYAAPPITQEYPVFWYRPHSDGLGYDGPIHDSQIEQVRRESGAWVPLIARPIQPAKGED